LTLFGFAEDDKDDAGFEMKSVVICRLSHEDAKVFENFASACAEEMMAFGADCDQTGFAGGEVPDVTIDRWFTAREQ